MNNIKKVLSIDFDYIMGPTINLYNDICAGDIAPSRVWDRLEKERNIEASLKYDKENLDLIYRLVAKVAKTVSNTKRIMFAENHDMILKLLCEDDGNKYDVYNVDQHHDIFYSEEQYKDVAEFGKASVGNWVLYLQQNGFLESYHWAKNSTSGKLQEKWDFQFEELSKYQAKSLMDIDFDYLFVCGSPQWVPYTFAHLYDTLKNTCEVIMGEKIEEQIGPYLPRRDENGNEVQ